MLVFHSKQLSLPSSIALLCTKISDKYKLAWWFFSRILYMYATIFQLGKQKDSQTPLLALTFRLGEKGEMGVGKGRRKDESNKSLSDSVCVCVCVSRSIVSGSLWPPWTVAHQAPLSVGFSRQEYYIELPFPFPGDLPDPGIKPRFSSLQDDPFLSEPLYFHIIKYHTTMKIYELWQGRI